MEDKIFFNSKYDFENWLSKNNRSHTFLKYSNFYDGYDCYFSGDISCYVLRDYKPCIKEKFRKFFNTFDLLIAIILGILLSIGFVYFILCNTQY